MSNSLFFNFFESLDNDCIYIDSGRKIRSFNELEDKKIIYFLNSFYCISVSKTDFIYLNFIDKSKFFDRLIDKKDFFLLPYDSYIVFDKYYSFINNEFYSNFYENFIKFSVNCMFGLDEIKKQIFYKRFSEIGLTEDLLKSIYSIYGDVTYFILENMYENFNFDNNSNKSSTNLVLELFKKLPKTYKNSEIYSFTDICYELYSKDVINSTFYTYMNFIFNDVFISKNKIFSKLTSLTTWLDFFNSYKLFISQNFKKNENLYSVIDKENIDFINSKKIEELEYFLEFKSLSEFIHYRSKNFRTKFSILEQQLVTSFLGHNNKFRVEFLLGELNNPNEKLRIVYE